MMCPECQTHLSRLQRECPKCGWQRPATVKDTQEAKNPASLDWQESLHRSAMQAAHFEARKYHLDPQAPGEPDEAFCKRINRQKTPKVMVHNLSVAKGLDYWNQQHGITSTLPDNLKKLLNRWLLEEREPGCDDERAI